MEPSDKSNHAVMYSRCVMASSSNVCIEAYILKIEVRRKFDSALLSVEVITINFVASIERERETFENINQAIYNIATEKKKYEVKLQFFCSLNVSG